MSNKLFYIALASVFISGTAQASLVVKNDKDKTITVKVGDTEYKIDSGKSQSAGSPRGSAAPSPRRAACRPAGARHRSSRSDGGRPAR